MKNTWRLPDAFVLSGFVASFFSGFLNPLYVSLILSRLDATVIAAGSFMASGFPVLVGLALGNRGVFDRLYAALPAVMLLELAAALGTAALAAVDLRAYYLVSMFVLGAFSSSVVYLLQKIKEVRYRRNRATFDRRCDMADATGLLLGSGLAVVGVSLFRDPLVVAGLGAVQTAAVYGLFLLLYRRVPSRRAPRTAEGGRDAGEEAHPRRHQGWIGRHQGWVGPLEAWRRRPQEMVRSLEAAVSPGRAAGRLSRLTA